MMRKKLLCLLIAANAALMASATITKRADYTAIVEGSTPVEGIRYVFNQESLTATVATIDSLMPDSIMHIPETVTYEGNTYTVTAIGENAFGYSGSVFSNADQPWISILQGLKKIIVPKTVKRIGAGAFHNTGWKGNTVPMSIRSKYSLLEGIYFEEGSQLEEVGENALGGPSASTSNINHLVTKVVFPDGMKAIPARCFYDCENIRTITLPASVETIGEEAFWHKNKIKYDPSTSAITSFNVNLSINSLVEIGSNAFGGYVQFNNESSSTDKKDLAISVKNVLANMLMGNKTVTQVVLSAAVEHIGSNAFANSAVSSISCLAVTPPTVAEGALPAACSVSVSFSSYEAYLQAEAWKDFLVGEWTFADNGYIDGEYRKLLYSTSYTLTYPDHVAIKECDMHGSAVLLADSVEYEGHKFAVQPEIPEGIFYDRLAESHSVNNYLERIVINTPVTRLPNMICDKDNNNKYLYLDESYGVCMSALKSIQLPETLEEIGDSAFFKMVILRNSYASRGVSSRSIEVNIPKNVKRIGDAAFCGVPLTNMNLPEGLKTIGKRAFFNHFADEISLPASVEHIGEDAFYTEAYYGDYEVSHITVASGNQHFKVEDDALYTADGKRLLLCTNQKSGYFNLPEGLSQIDEHALGYTELTGINMPSSLTQPNLLKVIPTANMSSIDVAEGNPVYKSIDGVLFNLAADTLLKYPPMKQLEEYTVPASVLVLGENSMSKTLLKKVNLPNTLREMREYALAYNSFKEIRLPDSLRYMYGYALGECNDLRSITVPDSVRWIALESNYGSYYRGGVIGGCANLRTIRFSGFYNYISPKFIRGHLSYESGAYYTNEIYQIADRETYDRLQLLRNDYTYNYNENWIKLVCEDDYAQIDGVEYYRERSGEATAINTLPTVKPQLTVPEKITIKGEECIVNKVTSGAFQNNSDIVSLSLSAKIDTIGYLDSHRVYYLDEESGNRVYYDESYIACGEAFAGMSQLKSFSLNKSAGHRVIGAGMFANCPKLESITWPDGVDTLGVRTFYGDTMLVNLNFTFAPELKAVPNEAFAYCTSLKRLSLPNVSAIGDGAFAYCEQLADLTIAEGTNDISLGQASFFGCKELAKLPAAERLQWDGDAYMYNPLEACLKLADYAPETIGNICLETSSGLSKNVTYVKDHLMLRDSYSINENDTVLSYRYAISYPAGCTDKSYAIPDGVMVLNPGAFSHSQFENLTIPASVKYVNYGSFAFNHQLKKIEMMSEIPPSLNILYPEEMNNVFIEEGHVLWVYNSSFYPYQIDYRRVSPFEQDVFDNATLYVPEGTVEAYRNSNWSMFRNIRSIDEPTGVKTIESQPSIHHHSAVYDMQGRRVNRNNLQKGLYIVDGKKVMR